MLRTISLILLVVGVALVSMGYARAVRVQQNPPPQVMYRYVTDTNTAMQLGQPAPIEQHTIADSAQRLTTTRQNTTPDDRRTTVNTTPQQAAAQLPPSKDIGYWMNNPRSNPIVPNRDTILREGFARVSHNAVPQEVYSNHVLLHHTHGGADRKRFG
jgi:hypothetical protein